MAKRRYWLVLLGLAAVALVILALRSYPRLQRPTPAVAAAAARKPLYWYDPMFPNQHFDHPGPSPFMDMQLVPRMPEEAPATAATAGGNDLHIDAQRAQNLGVRLARVEQGDWVQTLDAVAEVAVDEHRIVELPVRARGWVEDLVVRAVGDPVRRGQRLASVYAPELLTAQQEYLLALDGGDSELAQAARQRLQLLGVSSAQITALQQRRHVRTVVDYTAPCDGYVLALGARRGAPVTPETVLFRLAALDTVWLEVAVPEAQAAWLRAGNHAEAQIPAWPGSRFQGQVDYVYPELDVTTRTLKVRVAMNNPGLRLRPGMYASVHIEGATRPAVLSVPAEALIRTGRRSVVIVADEALHFRPVLVRAGAESDARTEILDGLSVGQQVVASGQFLIDSEASLRSAFTALTGGADAVTPDASAAGEVPK